MTKSIIAVIVTGLLLLVMPTNGTIMMFVAALFFLLGSLARRKPAAQRITHVPTSGAGPKPGSFTGPSGYASAGSGYSPEVKRMLQRSKDEELKNYVANGNREWARQQNEAAAKMKKAARLNQHAAMMQSMNMGYGVHARQMAQQAAWTNQAASMQMADAADLMMDAAVENDPFNFT